MAAERGTTNSAQNYYSIAYGKFAARAKEPFEGTEEISQEELKSKTMKVENIDLRTKYVKKDGDYPYQVFYSSLSGRILNVEKEEYEQGISLKVTIEDNDGELSTVTTKFYGKVSANLLNRLLFLDTLDKELVLSPYAIPSEFTTPEGKKINFYQSGVSVKDGNTKIKQAYYTEQGLPSTEQVQNAEGKMVTSRVKQINWLWDKLQERTTGEPPIESTNTPAPKTTTPATEKVAEPKQEQKQTRKLPF